MISEHSQKPQRLALLSLLYKFFRLAPHYALPVYFVHSAGSGENFIIISISLLVGIVILPSILLGHYYFTYKFADEELIINSGVLSRKQRNIPYSRIQNINIHQNILHRILGLAQVKIETAGDAQTEGTLDAVTRSGAKQIKAKLESMRSESPWNKVGNQTENIDISQETYDNITSEKIPENKSTKDTPKIQFSLGLKDLSKYGMMRFRPIVLLAMAWIFSIVQQMSFFNNKIYDTIGKDVGNYFTNQSSSLNFGEYALWIVAMLFFALLFSWIFDILLTINQFYKFKMEESNDKLNTDYGLLTKHSASIPLKKLQLITVFTNFFIERFDFYGFSIQTAGFGEGGIKKPEIAVPFAKKERIFDLATKVIPFDLPEHFDKVSKKHIRRFFLRQLFLLLFIAGILFASVQEYEVFYILLLLPPMFYYSYLRWKNLQYYFDNSNMIVKKGVFLKKMNIMPISKIQTIHTRRSIFQQMLGLSSVYIDSAAANISGDITIPDVPWEITQGLVNKIGNSFHNQ